MVLPKCNAINLSSLRSTISVLVNASVGIRLSLDFGSTTAGIPSNDPHTSMEFMRSSATRMANVDLD